MEWERERSGSHPMRQRDDTIGAALAWWQIALRLGGCRHGRHYARQVRDQAIAEGLVIDTGCVDKPKQRPDGRGRRWWPIYIVEERFAWRKTEWIGPPSFWPGRTANASIACLCSETIRKGLRARTRYRYGSVQAAFKATGPP